MASNNTTQAAEPIEVKTDCFAYRKGVTEAYACKALRELYCKKEKCNFYKPKESCTNLSKNIYKY